MAGLSGVKDALQLLGLYLLNTGREGGSARWTSIELPFTAKTGGVASLEMPGSQCNPAQTINTQETNDRTRAALQARLTKFFV